MKYWSGANEWRRAGKIASSVGTSHQGNVMKRGLILLCLGVAAALVITVSAGAQSAGFEVASIKPSNPNPTGPLQAAPMVLPALGRLTAQNVTLRMLVMAAYQKAPFEVVGG